MVSGGNFHAAILVSVTRLYDVTIVSAITMPGSAYGSTAMILLTCPYSSTTFTKNHATARSC